MVVVQVTCTSRHCAASLRLAELRLAASAAAPAAVTEAAWRRSAGAAGGTRRPAAGTTVDAPTGPPTTVHQRRGTAFSVRLTVTSILSSPEWALDRRTAD